MFSDVLFYVIRILDQRSLLFWTRGSWIMVGSWIMDHGSWITALASAIVRKEHFLQPRRVYDSRREVVTQTPSVDTDGSDTGDV